MKRFVLIFMALTWALSACAGQAEPTEQSFIPVDGLRPTPTQPAELTPAEEAAVSSLAFNLGVEASDISVVSSSDVEFPDACLGVALQDVACAEVITPGKIVVLKANGLEFEYHVSADGSHVQPATIAFIWTREGGIAGFCDRMTVFLSGEVYSNNCRSQQPESAKKVFADLLDATRQQEFFEWVQEFGHERLDASDPQGVSDQMVVTLEFYGNGQSQPSEAEIQTLFEFAQGLHQKLTR